MTTFDVPDGRKHHKGLVDAMEEADREAHRRGRHDDRQLDDCPLCPPKEADE